MFTLNALGLKGRGRGTWIWRRPFMAIFNTTSFSDQGLEAGGGRIVVLSNVAYFAAGKVVS